MLKKDKSYFVRKKVRGKRWRGAYYGRILNGYEQHRVFHCEYEFARGKSNAKIVRESLMLSFVK